MRANSSNVLSYVLTREMAPIELEYLLGWFARNLIFHTQGKFVFHDRLAVLMAIKQFPELAPYLREARASLAEESVFSLCYELAQRIGESLSDQDLTN